MATMTTAEIAEEFGCTAKTLRKFLRNDFRARELADSLPGKGSRYAIEKKEIRGMRGRFQKWQEAEKAKRDARLADSEESTDN